MALEKVTMTMVETVRPLPVSYPSLVPSPTALAHIVVSLGGRGQAERIAARVGQFLGKFLVQN